MKQVYILKQQNIHNNPRRLVFVGIQNEKLRSDLRLRSVAYDQKHIESVYIRTNIVEKIKDALIQSDRVGELKLNFNSVIEWNLAFKNHIEVDNNVLVSKFFNAIGFKQKKLKIGNREIFAEEPFNVESQATFKMYQNMNFEFVRDIDNYCSLKINNIEFSNGHNDSSILCGELIKTNDLGWFDDDDDQSSMWVGRYRQFLYCLMKVLQYVQNQGGLKGLTLEKLNDLVEFESIKSKLHEWSSLYGDDFNEVSKNLTAYLESLPGYRENDLQKALEQHGFIIMQLRRKIQKICAMVKVDSLYEFATAKLDIYGTQISKGQPRILSLNHNRERRGLMGMENLQDYRSGYDLTEVIHEALKDILSESKVTDI